MRLTRFHRGSAGIGLMEQPSMVAAPAWPVRRSVGGFTRSMSNWFENPRRRGTALFTVIGVLLGIFVVAQWHSTTTDLRNATSRDTAIHQTIDRLEAEQALLKKQIADLRAKTAAEQEQMTRSRSTSANLGRALSEQRALAGTVPVQGTGIELLLDDSNVHSILPSDDPDKYIVHEYQIRDIANVLWGSGASAISVNGERFVNSTSVYCVGSTILINDTRTSPPYHIRAVGDVAAMQKAILDGNNLSDLKARSQMYGVIFKVVRTGRLTVPAFDGSVEMKHTDIAYTTSQP